jgi:hypothetical protein
MTQDEWETVRRRWARLERKPLSPDEVFNTSAQRRIGRSIAREALSESQRVVRLKLARRSEGYYLLQAAEAQDRAERAQSPKDREAWQDVAAKWHGLLKRMKHSSEV